ncbi:unnamed protein product [Lampetra planeri]
MNLSVFSGFIGEEATTGCLHYILGGGAGSSSNDSWRDAQDADSVPKLLIGAQQQEPAYARVPMTLFYSAVFTLGMLFNGASILTLLLNSHLKGNVVRSYLLSLSVADILLLLTVPITLYRSYWHYHTWQLGNVTCKLYFMLRQVYCSATSWTITAFTVERYVAICRPLHSVRARHQRIKPRAPLALLALVWLLALLSSAPFALTYGVAPACILDYTVQPGSRDARGVLRASAVCELVEREPFRAYGGAIAARAALCFALPLCAIATLHALIYRRIRRRCGQLSSAGGDGGGGAGGAGRGGGGGGRGLDAGRGAVPCAAARQQDERKALKLLGAVVAAFFLCNFPETALSLVHIHTGQWSQETHATYTWLKFYLSLPAWYANSAVDPLLFCIASRCFRSACRHTLTSLLDRAVLALRLALPKRRVTLAVLRSSSWSPHEGETAGGPASAGTPRLLLFRRGVTSPPPAGSRVLPMVTVADDSSHSLPIAQSPTWSPGSARRGSSGAEE